MKSNLKENRTYKIKLNNILRSQGTQIIIRAKKGKILFLEIAEIQGKISKISKIRLFGGPGSLI